MATLTSPLRRKLTRVLTRHFPSPDTVKLTDNDGIIGVITSAKFQGMDAMDRQNMIGEYIEQNLNAEERHRIQVIVGLTPDENTAYSAGY